MKVENCFLLGYIIKPHGNQGNLQLFIDADYPESYNNLESVFVKIRDKLVPFFIHSIRIQGNKAVVSFEDVSDMEAAEKLKGLEVYLPDHMLPAMDEGSFYYHDIIGFTVTDKSTGELGVVENVYTQGIQDLISMRYKGKEILIPVIDEIILKADAEEKKLHVDLPDGLIDVFF
ncbi:MAG: 16S rRNA processing protein RimM [Cyclobacteriaceae bacterium]|nr:16S rRNA processing protein RimM [Cyclobacteriaceae bacterium]